MGREIRRVPPNWQHPKNERGQDQAMYDRRFDDAAREWKEALAAWERGERPDYASAKNSQLEYWEWEGGPPERAYYRPWKDEEATWYQLWQTVSEGSPVSPPFATMDELVNFLAKNGERAPDGSFRSAPWGMERAKAFCDEGWAPSMVIADGKAMVGTEFALHRQQQE